MTALEGALGQFIRTAIVFFAPACALAAQAEPPTFRLGDAAAPTSYEVRLAIDPREKRFEGEIRINLVVNRAVPTLWLNAGRLTIEAAEVEQGGAKIPVRPIVAGEDFVGLESAGAPLAAAPATVSIRYHGVIEERTTQGLFRQRDGDGWYAITQLEEHWARRVFPCFDEPQWKTPWRITIDAPDGNVVVSNAPEAGTDPVDGRAGWRRHRFERTDPLPTYLVAIGVGPFDVVDGGVAGRKPTRLRYFVPKGRAADARYAREATPKIVEALEDYFGSEFPFQKLDSVTIPQTVNFGAMENAGMITYATPLLIARPHEDSPTFRRRYSSVAAHEIAHQWFGDLVTLAWWDDTWLNESFATWMARKALAQIHPPWAAGWQPSEARRRALEADRLASARRIHQPIENDNDIAGAFDAITYQKGGTVLAMFEAWLGEDRFREGVREYLKRYSWGNATSKDFFRAIGEASNRGDEALTAFRAFVEQPGVPLIDMALKCEGGRASLETTQQRLKPRGSSASDAQWLTPACFRYPAGGKLETTCAEIAAGPQSIALAPAAGCPAWIAGNANGAGDYVPRYDAPLLKKIVSRATVLPEAEAIAVVDDAGLLARIGLITVSDELAVHGAFISHPSAAVKQAVVAMLEREEDAWLSSKDFAAKQALVRRALVPLAARLGWLERKGDSDQLRELRAALMPFVASTAEGEKFRTEARKLALRWIDDRSAVPATMVRPVLDTAARFADLPTYLRFESALRAEADRRSRSELIRALALVRPLTLRDRAFALVLAKKDGADAIDGRDAYQLLSDALEDEHNHAAAFAFVREHFEAIRGKIPPDGPTRFPRDLGYHICDDNGRGQYVDFFRDRVKTLRGGPRAYDQGLEAIDVCIASRG